MAKVYATPGVYIEEKSAFTTSAVPVATAVPAFIGYTQKAMRGTTLLTGIPTRISSYGEYRDYFGGPPKTTYDLKKQKTTGLFKLKKAEKRFLLDYSMRLFFANGGSDCYIVSVGNYEGNVAKAKLEEGLLPLLEEVEPTMIVIPDAVEIDSKDDFSALQTAVLKHCGQEMRQRVAILDVFNGHRDLKTRDATSQKNVIDDFREDIGINDLQWAAVYYPWLETSIAQPSELDFNNFAKLDEDPSSIKRILAPGIEASIAPKSKIKLVEGETVDYVITVRNTGKCALKEVTVAKPKIGSESKELTVTWKKSSMESEEKALKIGEIATYEVAQYTITEKDEQDKKIAIELTVSGKAPDDSVVTSVLPVPAPSAINASIASDANPVLEAGDTVTYTVEVANSGPVDLTLDKVEFKINGTAATLAPAKPAKLPPNGTYTGEATYTVPEVPVDIKYVLSVEGTPDGGAKETLGPIEGTDLANGLEYVDINLTEYLDSCIHKAYKDNVISVDRAQKIQDELSKLKDASTDVEKVKTLSQTLIAVSPDFKNLMSALRRKINVLPPSGAMAGIYSMVDNNVGVWQSPANVSIGSVVKPTVNITSDDQEDLNLPLNGKAVNAIRTFPGKGNLVWGARTLDGNSMDWRYISVRRTVIFIEQSIKNAAETYVFAPNTSLTWTNVNAMITNFLTNVWQQGGLAGTTPEDAFSVEVGLGVTMTAVDILDGIMRVTVKIAVTRPAEFIVITFEQQMQKS